IDWSKSGTFCYPYHWEDGSVVALPTVEELELQADTAVMSADVASWTVADAKSVVDVCGEEHRMVPVTFGVSQRQVVTGRSGTSMDDSMWAAKLSALLTACREYNLPAPSTVAEALDLAVDWVCARDERRARLAEMGDLRAETGMLRRQMAESAEVVAQLNTEKVSLERRIVTLGERVREVEAERDAAVQERATIAANAKREMEEARGRVREEVTQEVARERAQRARERENEEQRVADARRELETAEVRSAELTSRIERLRSDASTVTGERDRALERMHLAVAIGRRKFTAFTTVLADAAKGFTQELDQICEGEYTISNNEGGTGFRVAYTPGVKQEASVQRVQGGWRALKRLGKGRDAERQGCGTHTEGGVVRAVVSLPGGVNVPGAGDGAVADDTDIIEVDVTTSTAVGPRPNNERVSQTVEDEAAGSGGPSGDSALVIPRGRKRGRTMSSLAITPRGKAARSTRVTTRSRGKK
ncbi:MAG: hypothetical protein AAF471_08225, partial [Myxococcota bacterium]